ncbi:MAG: hypothetical protein WA962_02945 [Ornithinimicrobium sp.]
MSIPPEGVPEGNDDADPTGMREVLSALPDPGPMPPDLTDRICASLEREQGLHGQDRPWPAVAAVPEHGSERTHRRPQQWILAAAAVLAVGVIGTVVFDQVLNSQSSADQAAAELPSPPGEESNAASTIEDNESQAPIQDDAAAAEAGSAADEGQSAADEADGVPKPQLEADPPPAGDAALTRAALDAVDDDAFAAAAASLLGIASGEAPAERATRAPALSLDLSDVQPLADQELKNCVGATGQPLAQGSWVAAPTAINGADIVIVGSTDSGEPSQAWAVGQDCPQNPTAAVLKGPVPLP